MDPDSLEDPVQNYALQMTELEAFGRPAVEAATLLISQQPQNTASAPARTAAFAVAARLLNGDPNLIAYQWQKNGTNIPGAAGPVYTTPLLLAADEGAKYRCILTYPGLAPVTSDEAVLSFDYNYARGTQAFSNRPLWLPGGWNIAMLVDGSRSGVFHGHENIAPGFAYEVNMGLEVTIERIDLYPRQDGCCPERLMNFRVSVHKDNNGQIGDQVWMADLFTDGSNPGSTADTVVTLTRDLDPAGQFKGQWIRILSLEDPVQNYALQMTELEVIGRVSDPLILAVRRAGAGIVLTWSDGTLESADNINGGWMPVQGAVSPHSVEAIGTSKFYRLSRGGAP
jgi:hypothetical protein